MSRSKLFILSIAILFLAAACNKQVIVKPAPNHPATGETSFSGKFIAGGVECQLFQADDGKQYTLTGHFSGFKEGDAVNIKGTFQEISYCQQGHGTIAVSTITHADETSSMKFEPSPTLAMTLGAYAERRRIVTAIDTYYFENKKLPKGYSDLVTAGLLTNSSPDTDFLSYLQYNLVSNTQIDICLKFRADKNRPDEPQCKSYLAQ